jgi:riboflavin synthase alpha subunit
MRSSESNRFTTDHVDGYSLTLNYVNDQAIVVHMPQAS